MTYDDVKKMMLKDLVSESFLEGLSLDAYQRKLLIGKVKLFSGEQENATVDDFLKHVWRTDSDIKAIVPRIQKLSLTSRLTKEIPASELKDLQTYGYFIESDSSALFYGRQEALQFVTVTLSRKIKNNLLILGEPGVGKTALVCEYARQQSSTVFLLELNKMLSDTKYRGEFEKKITSVLTLAKKYGFKLFIDEIHVLLNAGNVEGGMSASNLLKPYITDPELILIGATTNEEYQHLVLDKALERRFNILKLSELSQEALLEVYKKLLAYLAIKTLSIEDFEVIKKGLDQEVNRHYPDKLIDYLDLYASFEKIKGEVTIDEVLEISRHGN